MVLDTRVFRFNYWFACSITQSFMLTDSGIQCAYGRTITHGRTFGSDITIDNFKIVAINNKENIILFLSLHTLSCCIGWLLTHSVPKFYNAWCWCPLLLTLTEAKVKFWKVLVLKKQGNQLHKLSAYFMFPPRLWPGYMQYIEMKTTRYLKSLASCEFFLITSPFACLCTADTQTDFPMKKQVL